MDDKKEPDKKEPEKESDTYILPSGYTGPLKPGVRYVKLWDTSVIEDGTPEYKKEGTKQIFTQKFTNIYVEADIGSPHDPNEKSSSYVLEYYDFEEEYGTKPSGLITIEAEPISQEKTKYGSRIKYQGKFELNYNLEESDPDENDIKNLHLTAEVFTMYITGRYDGMREWEIVLNPGENEIKLELTIGYYASILKADADAKAIFKL
jgi:hypothetical protein